MRPARCVSRPSALFLAHLTDCTCPLGRSTRRASACTTLTSSDHAPTLTTAPCWTSSMPGGRWTIARQPSGHPLAPLQGTIRTVRLRCSYPNSFPCRTERDYTSLRSNHLTDITKRPWYLRYHHARIRSDMALRRWVTIGRHSLQRAVTLTSLHTHGQDGGTAGR